MSEYSDLTAALWQARYRWQAPVSSQPTVTDLETARGILESPQAFVNALVGAGVLKQRDTYGRPHDFEYYTVIQPHKHEWYVFNVNGAGVDLHCMDSFCTAAKRVPNQLPIEVPGV